MVVFHPFNGKLECIFRPIRDFNTGTMHRRIAIMVRFAGDAAIDGKPIIAKLPNPRKSRVGSDHAHRSELIQPQFQSTPDRAGS